MYPHSDNMTPNSAAPSCTFASWAGYSPWWGSVVVVVFFGSYESHHLTGTIVGALTGGVNTVAPIGPIAAM